ncbi:acyl-CoA dehydrogenase family protein [Pseudonocardia ailaonensis]|uniref:Acyl-CoA dehydrogenase family protein n=1 Tax=Pseudonocardia ailaonensis TaxID=367279 RepID=A0ABN2MIH2_9PSEU
MAEHETTAVALELRDAVRQFLDKHATDDDQARRFDSADPADSADLVQGLADLGAFAVCAPESADGLGLGPAALVPLFTLFGERLVTGPVLEQCLLPGLLLEQLPDGLDPRAGALLRDAVVGERRVALADGGASLEWRDLLQGLETGPSGIEGTVGMARSAGEADVLVLVADGPEPAVALVEAPAPGLRVDPIEIQPNGSRFAAVTVAPGTTLLPLAEGEAARRLIVRIRAWTRLLLAAELAGLARRAVDDAVAYVKVRKQFGKPVGTFQAVKHIAATATARTVVAENVCRAAAEDAAGLPLEEFSAAAMAAKAYCSEFGPSVCEDAIQLHGGIGFTKELPLHRYYMRSLALRSWYGDETELSEALGRALLAAGGTRP